MATRSGSRLFFGLLYLVALFGGAGWLYGRLQHFEGELCLYEGQAEVLAARPAGGAFSLSAAHRGLPAELLPWRNPDVARRYFGVDGRFDAAPLPGALKLSRVEVIHQPPPREVLHVEGRGDRQEFAVRDGAQVALDDATLTITGVRPWTGLVRDPRGGPMAALSLKPADADWSEPLLLQQGRWSLSGTTLAVRFDRGGDAAPAWPVPMQPETGARWGVRDGKAVQWAEGLVAGSGFTLQDGSEVQFVRFDPARAAILLAHRRAAEPEPVWVPANENPAGANYFFEAPGLCKTVVRLWGRGEGAALAGIWQAGASAWQQQELALHTPWAPDGVPYQLRLDQAMDRAVPVPRTDPPVTALVLQTPEGPRQLREGELTPWRDARLRFRRVPQPPAIRAHLEARAPGEAPQVFTLAAGETHRWGDWVFAVQPNPAEGRRSVVVQARRTFGGPQRIFAIGLFLIGAFGLVVVRFMPHRSKDEFAGPADIQLPKP